MKLLLTSAGISNPSIHNALVDLLGKPVNEASALFIPTAIYALPRGGDIARSVICGLLGDPFCDLGWKSLGILELTALPGIKQALWIPVVGKRTPYWLEVATVSISATGCTNPGWRTCYLRCCKRLYMWA